MPVVSNDERATAFHQGNLNPRRADHQSRMISQVVFQRDGIGGVAGLQTLCLEMVSLVLLKRAGNPGVAGPRTWQAERTLGLIIRQQNGLFGAADPQTRSSMELSCNPESITSKVFIGQ